MKFFTGQKIIQQTINFTFLQCTKCKKAVPLASSVYQKNDIGFGGTYVHEVCPVQPVTSLT